MDVLIITLFITLVLVTGGVLLLVRSVKQGDFEHGDRLSLLPLEDDAPGGKAAGPDTPADAARPPGSEPRAS